MTFGEKAVGISFNPGGNQEVSDCKNAFAAIIDKLNDRRMAAQAVSDRGEEIRLLSVAITEAQAAQMWAVKAITWQ